MEGEDGEEEGDEGRDEDENDYEVEEEEDKDDDDYEIEEEEDEETVHFVIKSIRRRKRRSSTTKRPPQTRKKTKTQRKTPKPHTCRDCNMPMWSTTGHSQFQGKIYCPHAPGQIPRATLIGIASMVQAQEPSSSENVSNIKL